MRRKFRSSFLIVPVLLIAVQCRSVDSIVQKQFTVPQSFVNYRLVINHDSVRAHYKSLSIRTVEVYEIVARDYPDMKGLGLKMAKSPVDRMRQRARDLILNAFKAASTETQNPDGYIS